MSEEFIEFEGDKIRLVRNSSEGRRVVKEALISDFLEELSKRRGIVTPELPPGTRLYSSQGKKEIVVIEEQPQVRTVKWEEKSYNLAFPYIVFVITKTRIQVFFRKGPINSLEDRLYSAVLPNITAGNTLCKGEFSLKGSTITELTKNALNFFWNSAFGEEEVSPLWQQRGKVDERLKTVKAWQKATAADSLFVLEVEWPPAGLTVKQAVETELRTKDLRLDSDKIADMLISQKGEKSG